jgi:probable rRNA maturation factor
MIEFNYETAFNLENESIIIDWLKQLIEQENCTLKEINYIFCDDDYLHKLNVDFLDHDTLTDVISFDYCVGKYLQGDIFISVERVAENAKDFEVSFLDELFRVMSHGLFHFCGYKDKDESDILIMRSKENEALVLINTYLNNL